MCGCVKSCAPPSPWPPGSAWRHADAKNTHLPAYSVCLTPLTLRPTLHLSSSRLSSPLHPRRHGKYHTVTLATCVQHSSSIQRSASIPKQTACTQESWRKRRNSSINPANKENVCKYHQFTDYIFSCRANVGSQSTQSIIYVHMYCILCLNLLHLACCAILNTTPWYYKMHLNLINSACWVILKDSLK